MVAPPREIIFLEALVGFGSVHAATLVACRIFPVNREPGYASASRIVLMTEQVASCCDTEYSDAARLPAISQHEHNFSVVPERVAR